MTGMDGINSLQKMLGALQVNESTSVNGAAAANKAGSSTTAATASTSGSSANMDRASFSTSGMAAMSSTDMSDVRTTKVAELRQAIANGTYNVPASAVADKMIQNMLS